MNKQQILTHFRDERRGFREYRQQHGWSYTDLPPYQAYTHVIEMLLLHSRAQALEEFERRVATEPDPEAMGIYTDACTYVRDTELSILRDDTSGAVYIRSTHQPQ